METTDARALSPEAQEALRKKAVKAVLEGRSRTEVAVLFGVTRQTVALWVKAYPAKGECTSPRWNHASATNFTSCSRAD